MSLQKLMADNKGNTVYADCYGLLKEYKERIITPIEHWGRLKEEEIIEEPQTQMDTKVQDQENEDKKEDVVIEAPVEYQSIDLEIENVNIQKTIEAPLPEKPSVLIEAENPSKADSLIKGKEEEEKYSRFKF